MINGSQYLFGVIRVETIYMKTKKYVQRNEKHVLHNEDLQEKENNT